MVSSESLDMEKTMGVKESVVDYNSDKEQNLEISDNMQKVVGLNYFEEAKLMTHEEIEDAHKKLRLKIDYHLVPLLCITYMLQFLDKSALNYAAAYTFIADLDLVGQRYSWVAAIFNFGYLFWALPGNYLIQKLPVGKYTAFLIFTWSTILIGHIGAKNYGGILVLRFILGMFEASISPSCMAICSMFYTKDEQPFRMCTFLSFNGVSTMVGALLGYGLGHAKASSLNAWKLIFLVIGILNLVWSVFFFFLCPDSPINARFLNEREKAIIIERISRNNMGIKNISFKKYQAVEVFTDYKTYIYALIGLCTGVVNGGVSNFTSALLKGFGFSGINATIIQFPAGAIELGVVFGTGIIAITYKNLRVLLLILTCIPGLGGLIGIQVTSLEHKWQLVGCTWLQGIIGAPIILSWVLLSANVAGHSKRTITNGIWFAFYASGNIIGANIFYANQAPKYRSGMIGMIVCYGSIILLGIALRFGLQYENSQRNKECGGYTEEIARQAAIDGFKDMTDKENRGFRYSL